MDIKIVSVTREVKVNLTPDEWQLYTTTMDCAAAAERLNRAMEAAVRTKDRGAARKEFMSALRKEEKFGALDSEPIHVTEYVLDKIYGKEDD